MSDPYAAIFGFPGCIKNTFVANLSKIAVVRKAVPAWTSNSGAFIVTSCRDAKEIIARYDRGGERDGVLQLHEFNQLVEDLRFLVKGTARSYDHDYGYFSGVRELPKLDLFKCPQEVIDAVGGDQAPVVLSARKLAGTKDSEPLELTLIEKRHTNGKHTSSILGCAFAVFEHFVLEDPLDPFERNYFQEFSAILFWHVIN